ncbi:MAG: SCO family protein [Gammaproteobacteria bacterium]|nr:SCO family protein [Gammaproteobacteria bacterium]
MPRLLIATIILAGTIAGIAAAQYFRRADPAPPELERAAMFAVTRALPEFALIDHAGQPFGPGRLRGQWTFLFFGFVNCPDVCPTTLATLAAVRNSLADLPGDRQPAVALVSVDPDRDTPDVLAPYVTHFDRSFTGVTGTRESIGVLTDGLGVAVMTGPADAAGNYSVDHTAAIFLVDPEGRVAALFSGPHEAGTIARDYRRIVTAR